MTRLPVGLFALLAASGCVTTTTTTVVRGGPGEVAADSGDAGDDEDVGGRDDTGASGDTGGTEATAEPCAVDAEGRLPRGDEGAFLTREAVVSAERPACAAGWHAAAGAAGSRLSIQLDAADEGGLWVTATGLDGEPLRPSTWLEPGEALEVPLWQSGELFVEVHPDEVGAVDDPPGAYALSVRCVEACDRAYTRYPVVFLHGMGGTDAYLGTLDYWFGVETAFDAAGLEAAFPAVDALATIDERAQQWAAELDALAGAGLGRRFNLIAHSQGGLDARRLIHAHDPEGRVVSLTTISSPHRGTALADLADGVLDLTPFDAALVDGAVAALAALVGLSGPDLSGQLNDMTRENMAAFNGAVPDRADVAYFSWAGASCRGFDWGCQWDRNGEIIDPVFSASFRLLDAVEGDNDGVVSVESARWGTFLGELPADHMDEVGQVADLINPAFDAQDFYVSEAARLFEAGL